MAGFNKSIKFVPAVGLHRTPLSGRRLSSRYEKTLVKRRLRKVVASGTDLKLTNSEIVMKLYSSFLTICLAFLLSGCSGEPSEAEAEKLVLERLEEVSFYHGAMTMSNFELINSFEESEDVYLADIAYTLSVNMDREDYHALIEDEVEELLSDVKLTGVEMKKERSRLMSQRMMPHALFGQFKTGDSRNFSLTIELHRTDQGWIHQGVRLE